MKFITFVLLSLALISVYTKDCGPNYGKCKNNECCSKYGYCGSSSAHCGSGCQPDYGKCENNDSGSYPSLGLYSYYEVPDVKELSGLTISKDGSFLWGVGDSGDLVKISASSFKVTKVNYFNDDDTEGVTINRDTGDLLISVEPNKVYIVTKSSDFKDYERLFKVSEAKNYGNLGFEGITYYKDNQVYLGSQEGPYLWRVKFDGEVKEKIELKKIISGITEVAGLCYDDKRDRLWIIDSEERKIFLLSGDGKTLLKTYKVPDINNPESISVDHINKVIWVGDDSKPTSRLYKFDVSNL